MSRRCSLTFTVVPLSAVLRTTWDQGKEAVRKQIGMAGPCKGAQVIYEAILRTFAGIPYESVEPNIDEE